MKSYEEIKAIITQPNNPLASKIIDVCLMNYLQDGNEEEINKALPYLHGLSFEEVKMCLDKYKEEE